PPRRRRQRTDRHGYRDSLSPCRLDSFRNRRSALSRSSLRPFSLRRRPNGVSIRRRFGPAFLASLAWHIAIVAMLWLATRAATRPVRSATVLPDRTITQMVWLNDPGPGGGGGGGGNRMTDPPRHASLPGRDAITAPASKPRSLDASKPVT